MKMKLIDWSKLTEVCKNAMILAKENPGRYGGRYVARGMIEADGFFILDDDDPELYRDDKSLDILAQVTPDKVWAIGRARRFLNDDGTVDFGE